MTAKTAEPTDALLSDTITIRGKEYRLEEVTADDYEECVRLSTEGSGDDERVNNSALSKFLAERCVKEPKLSTEDLGKLGVRAHAQLLRAVNRLNFGENAEDRYIRYLQSLAPSAMSFARFLVDPPEAFAQGND